MVQCVLGNIHSNSTLRNNHIWFTFYRAAWNADGSSGSVCLSGKKKKSTVIYLAYGLNVLFVSRNGVLMNRISSFYQTEIKRSKITVHKLDGWASFSCLTCLQRILSREDLKGEIMLLPVSVPLSLFQLECASLNNQLTVRAQRIQDLYVQFSVNEHRDLVKEWVRPSPHITDQ